MINISIACSNAKNELSDAVAKRNRYMIVLTKKEVNYAPKESTEFKCLTNSFCTDTSEICSGKTLGNCYFIMSMNCMHDFLVKWTNLH